LNMVPLDKAEAIADSQIDGGAASTAGQQREARAVADFEVRSLAIRDRIGRHYFPLFIQAAQRVVNREAIAVKKQLDKQRKIRAAADLEAWLEEFYRDLPAYIRKDLGPVFDSFSRAIADAAGDEIAQPMDEEELGVFIGGLIDNYIDRHAGSSLGQLRSLIPEGLDSLEQRVEEWNETRPEKIANNETVRASSAVYQAVAFAAGFSTYWRIRGPRTCPYCRELNGRKVSRGQSFVNSGDVLEPQGAEGPMKIRGMKAHPPLHQKCDCYLGV